MRQMVRVLRVLVALVVLSLCVASCASIWGFEPLSLAPDDDAGAAADGSIDPSGGRDSGNDALVQSDAQPADTSTFDAPPASGLTCVSSNGSCTCNANGAGNGAGCSATVLGVEAPSVVCCADPTFPANGACTCQWVGCHASGAPSPTQCICSPLYDTPGGTCAPSTWTCCTQNSGAGCICSTNACLGGYTAHGNSCGIAGLACGGAQRKVASCR